MNECPDTYKNIKCLICDRYGSLERPVVSIDDWYPKPPEPCPDPEWFIPYYALVSLFVIAFFVAYLLAHIL